MPKSQPVFHIDARGADAFAVKRLQEDLKRRGQRKQYDYAITAGPGTLLEYGGADGYVNSRPEATERFDEYLDRSTAMAEYVVDGDLEGWDKGKFRIRTVPTRR